MGKRRRAREMAIQMLYQSDLGGSPLAQIFHNFALQSDLGADPEDQGANAARRRGREDEGQALTYARSLVSGTLEHLGEIDGMIREQADNWRIERMPAVDRNILRLAIYEMLYERDVPKVVILDEAIELAKKFGSEQSGRFVNGLLDGLLKENRLPGTLK